MISWNHCEADLRTWEWMSNVPTVLRINACTCIMMGCFYRPINPEIQSSSRIPGRGNITQLKIEHVWNGTTDARMFEVPSLAIVAWFPKKFQLANHQGAVRMSNIRAGSNWVAVESFRWFLESLFHVAACFQNKSPAITGCPRRPGAWALVLTED